MSVLTPADADFFQTAANVATTEVEIGATPEEVWAIINDHLSWTEWFPGMKSVDAQPPQWTQVGDSRQVKVNFLTVSEQAIIVEPEADLAFTILEWPLPIAKRAAERVQLVDTSRQGENRVSLVYSGAFDLTMSGKLAWSAVEKQFVSTWGSAFENLQAAVAKRRR